MEWKVNYEDLEFKNNHYPFWKCQVIVEAESRKEAIEKAQDKVWDLKRNSNFRASKIK